MSKKNKIDKKPNPYRALLPSLFTLGAGVIGLAGMAVRWAGLIADYKFAVALIGFGVSLFTLIGFIWTAIRIADDWQIVPRKFLLAVLAMMLPAIIHLIWVSQYLYVFREPDEGVLR